MLRSTIYCRCLWFRSGAKKYDLLPLFVVSEWCSSAEKYDLLALFVVSEWCPSAKKYDWISLFGVRSGAPVLRSTICCR